MTKEELSKLTSEEKRDRIAEACGYIRPFTTEEEDWSDEGGGGRSMVTRDSRFNPIPDYLNDLNAMHAAEMQHFDTLVSKSHWLILSAVMGNGLQVGHWPATAAQRADAFLLTV